MVNLPETALSVRQPWAWAIVAGHKVIENRSAGSIRAGGMDCRRVAIHAAVGLTQREYDWGAWRLGEHGLRCPWPDDLSRGCIIGAVDVVEIVSESNSEWFGGQMGLVLSNAVMCDPIPAKGELGYFRWSKGGVLAPVAPWMKTWGRSPGALGDLFDVAPSWEKPPPKPFG